MTFPPPRATAVPAPIKRPLYVAHDHLVEHVRIAPRFVAREEEAGVVARIQGGRVCSASARFLVGAVAGFGCAHQRPDSLRELRRGRPLRIILIRGYCRGWGRATKKAEKDEEGWDLRR